APARAAARVASAAPRTSTPAGSAVHARAAALAVHARLRTASCALERAAPACAVAAACPAGPAASLAALLRRARATAARAAAARAAAIAAGPAAPRELAPAGVRATAEVLTRLRVLRAATVPLLRALVAIADALAVVDVVLPVAVLDVGLVEVVVAVDVDVDVAAAPVAVAPERRADRHAGAEGDQARAQRVARRIVRVRRIGRVRPRAVDDRGVVGGDVDDLGIRGLDDDRLTAAAGGRLFDGDALLAVALEVSLLLRL